VFQRPRLEHAARADDQWDALAKSERSESVRFGSPQTMNVHEIVAIENTSTRSIELPPCEDGPLLTEKFAPLLRRLGGVAHEKIDLASLLNQR
jgi:hypothetical protein